MPDTRYPMLWQRNLIQPRVRARANHQCEGCGMLFIEGTNLSVELHNGRKMIGTVHHINEDKQDCSMKNLVFLCQRCHFSIHANNWRVGFNLPKTWKGKPQKWIVDRGIPYKGISPNQLSLFELGL